MPNFLWTAKDKFGKTVVREVTANTIEDSKVILLAEGCTNLALKSEEIMDAVRGGFAKPVHIPAEERLKYLKLSQNTLGQIFERVIQDRFIYLWAIALLIIELFNGQKTIVMVICLAIIAWLAFRIWGALPEIYYVKLNRAREWHQWTDVLKLCGISEKIRRIHYVRFPDREFARFRAQALAGLGRLPEALVVVGQCENQPRTPSWLYKIYLAETYDAAKEYDRALECIQKGLEEKPTATFYLGLMNRLLYYKKDTIKAREALIEIEKNTLVDIAKPVYMRCCGILAYLEGDLSLARRELESSLEIFEREKKMPFRDANISVTKSYLCCVLAKQGDIVTAKKYFARARTYLVATDQTEMLEECKMAVGE